MKFVQIIIIVFHVFSLSEWNLISSCENCADQNCRFVLFQVLDFVHPNQVHHVNMPKSKCALLHPDRNPGPCVKCGDSHTFRYTHLIQKRDDDPDLYSYLKENFKFSDLDCICRTCDSQLKRIYTRSCENEQEEVSTKKPCSPKVPRSCFLSNYKLCEKSSDHNTNIDPNLFQKAFGIDISELLQDGSTFLPASMCHTHYNCIYNCKKDPSQCFICDKSSRQKKYTSISEDKRQLFFCYFSELMNDSDIVLPDKISCCPNCYWHFNSFCRSEAGEEAVYQTLQYLTDCLSKLPYFETVSVENIDHYTISQITEFVVKSLQDDKTLLVPVVYEKYKDLLIQNVESLCLILTDSELEKLFHNSKWMMKRLKLNLGKGILYYSPKRRQAGGLIYRNGTDLVSILHSVTVENYEMLSQKSKQINLLQERLRIAGEDKRQSLTDDKILMKAINILKPYVKIYTTENICKNDLPDIHEFDPISEIKQIPPVLWNFLFRISSTDKEDKDWLKSVASWDQHYIENPFNVSRSLPRLLISSCIFNTQNSQCVQPLHLLLTDIADKFSHASSLFLSINAKLGIGISKDSLQRYVANRVRELEEKSRFISSNSFTIASFDNLDKNRTYSIVGAGRDKSGFHGTTIQSVIPKPVLDSNTSICSISTGDVKISRDRKIPPEVMDSISQLEDIVGPPSTSRS